MSVFERKYCIVDSSGNYYTVNEYDALVVAKGAEAAEWFDILEANKRINNSGMGKSLRTVEANKSLCTKKTRCSAEESSGEFSMEDIDLSYLAKELFFLQSNIEKYQVDLRKNLSEVDEEICDIMHFVELYERDNEQSLELMDKLFECRKRRRKIKDEYFRAETFAKIFNSGGIANFLKDINRQMDNMDKREYTPRRLHYLFVQGTKLDDGKDEEYIEDCREWDKEEEPVTYERHDTIFDGRKNNWSAWVSEQAKMFENMQQYAINLQLDVEDLNEQIEELMIACEEANCNVAQGYKMFKQLKELRLARKAKEEELDKVYAIIGCFDCAAMADTYRYLESIIYGEPEEKAGVLSLENAENTDEIREAM